ncbi:Uncharacterised protein [Actinomyces viscosus]|uniref:Uncharacterized protein n=1 Tax=Actinomyces viscosus TaxID=1656 RepID=A0A3S4XBC1_ACTVI|nr:Uncharacterised protein [Actinomyces viscosus]
MTKCCPRTWLSYWRFGFQLAVCHTICIIIVTLAPGWSTTTLLNLAVTMVAAIAAAATAAIMEMFWPHTNWKSEREVLRHPRKYVPGITAFIAASCVWFLSVV